MTKNVTRIMVHFPLSVFCAYEAIILNFRLKLCVVIMSCFYEHLDSIIKALLVNSETTKTLYQNNL